MKVVVAMSGGVDSSVAAALLKEKGYQVTGVTMQTWDGEAAPGGSRRRHGCYGPDDEEIEDARKVAQTLGIPHFVFDLKKEFKEEVLDYFRHEYISGRTPNPCLRCNHKIKFDALLKKAKDSGIEFDYFATGHYARVEYDESQHCYLLKKARDLSKDQSYFLSYLSQEQLGRLLLPIGDYTKDEVRKMATCFGLSVGNKPDSQDFISGGYSSILDAVPLGPIMDRQGNILGEHRGITFYTVGQRKRLGISTKEPLYVTEIDSERNAVIVGSKEETYRDELTASGLNWIAIEELKRPTEAKARIRHLHKEAEAIITPLSKETVYVKFREPQMAITPGQTVVFYHEDIVVGAGTIEQIKSVNMPVVIAGNQDNGE